MRVKLPCQLRALNQIKTCSESIASSDLLHRGSIVCALLNNNNDVSMATSSSDGPNSPDDAMKVLVSLFHQEQELEVDGIPFKKSTSPELSLL